MAKSADEQIIAALENRDAEVRTNAAIALGRSKAAWAVELLIIALNDENDYLRLHAAEALGRWGKRGKKKKWWRFWQW